MLSAIAQEIWHTVFRYGTLLIAVHRPGKLDERVYRLSRWIRDRSDLKLDPAVFKQADQKWGPQQWISSRPTSVDMFTGMSVGIPTPSVSQ